MQQIALYVWTALVVAVLQSLYLTWRVWPSVRGVTQHLFSMLSRKLHCAWCWKSLRITRWYPEQWSSTICAHHERKVLAQSAARRQVREARQREAISTEVSQVVVTEQQREVIAW